jgi:hypothetical protein
VQRLGDGAAVCACRAVQSRRRGSEIFQHAAAVQQCPRRRGGEHSMQFTLHRVGDHVPIGSGKAV